MSKDTIHLTMPLIAAISALGKMKDELKAMREKEAANPGDDFWTNMRIDAEAQYTEFDRAVDLGELTD